MVISIDHTNSKTTSNQILSRQRRNNKGCNNNFYFINDLTATGTGQLCTTHNGGELFEVPTASDSTSLRRLTGGIYYYNVGQDKTFFINANGQSIEIGAGKWSRDFY